MLEDVSTFLSIKNSPISGQKPPKFLKHYDQVLYKDTCIPTAYIHILKSSVILLLCAVLFMHKS